MRFTLYAVALLQAATMAVDVPADAPDMDQVLAQTEAENASLVDALSKVIGSLNTNAQVGSGRETATDQKDDSKSVSKIGCAVGTNIAITTATDQHINIFVPQDPACAVAVKKTEGVKIVESDSDKGGANEAVRKALQAKVKSSLTKATLNDLSDDDNADEADDKDIKAMEKKIKAAKEKSAELAKKLKGAAPKKLAQTGAIQMTEDEILSLAQIYAEENFADEVYDQFAQSDTTSSSDESSSESSATGGSSDSDSDSQSSGSESSSDDLAQIGFGEEEIFAQVNAQPEVKLVPQVHVQVTRVGADGQVQQVI